MPFYKWRNEGLVKKINLPRFPRLLRSWVLLPADEGSGEPAVSPEPPGVWHITGFPALAFLTQAGALGLSVVFLLSVTVASPGYGPDIHPLLTHFSQEPTLASQVCLHLLPATPMYTQGRRLFPSTPLWGLPTSQPCPLPARLGSGSWGPKTRKPPETEPQTGKIRGPRSIEEGV